MFQRRNVKIVKTEERIHSSSSGSKGVITVKETVQTIENGESTIKESVSVTELPEEFAKKLVTSASITNYNRSSTPSSQLSSPTTPSPPLPSSSGRGSTSSFSSKQASATSRSAIPASPGKGEDFAEDSLQRHNEYRQKHGVPSLKLSHALCKYAQEWANKLAQMNTLRHRSDHTYGENIFMTSKDVITGKDAVDSWYGEIKDYVFGQEPVSMSTGHFTQVVWKSSSELGIAKAHGRNGTYVVANYDPPGNMFGQYVANVPSPR